MKLIVIPLMFLVTFALLGMLGMGTGGLVGGGQMYGAPDGYYDSTGHLCAYLNGTAAGEAGSMIIESDGIAASASKWQNTTGKYTVTSGDSTVITFNLQSSLGLIGLVIGVMALATVAGIKIVGSGISDESVSAIIKGTAWLTVWGIFSVLALGLISLIPYFGVVFYFVLTAMYTLGVINSIGHPSGE